jgi:hypothetical protein
MTASASLGTVNNGQYLSAVDVYYHGCGSDLGSGCHYGFRKTDQAAGAGVWEYRYFEDAQINLTSSVKADYTFHINFQGNASGQVNINSASNVLLGGNIYNPTGSTSILATQGSGGSIIGSASGGITTNGLTLKATGSVGDASNPLNVVMTGGKLSVDSGAAGTNIAATTALDLDHVTAGNATTGYGDVTLTSGGSITGGSGTSITGRDITLSAGGAIGGALNGGNPLVIAAHATTAADHSIDHGVVSLDALNDINVRQTGGDLLVGLIKSEGGSVNVDVPDGSIVDAAGITSGQALSSDQLKTVSETLHLTTADDNGAIAAATKQRIEQTADGYYTQYQGLMDNGQVVGGSFVLDTSKLDLYRPLAAAELGHAASDADVQAYVAGRYSTYDTYFKGLLGADYATTAKFTTPVASFNYVASDAQVDALTDNAFWKEGWLTSAVNNAALTDPGNKPVGSAAPNIQGRNVTLTAKKNIGALGDTATISATDLINGTVSDEDAAALAAANAPGDITLVRDSNGALVSVQVRQTQPLFLTAGGTVAASNQAGSGGSIYLQANGDLNLGGITSDKDVSLVAVGNINNTLTDPTQAVIKANGDLTMLVGSGSSIGNVASTTGGVTTPERAVSYDIGGTLLAADASQDVVLRALNHDLVFDRIGGNGQMVLHTLGNIEQALDGLALTGRGITLDAGGNVGYLGDNSKFLQLSTGTGTVDGTVSGFVRLDDTTANALNIGTLAVGSNVDVVATGDLNVTSLTSTTGYLNASSGGDAVIGIVKASGPVDLTAVGDLTVGSATSAATTGIGATLEAGKAIIATDDGSHQANVTVGDGASVLLKSSTGIGSPLRVHGGYLTATADNGDIDLALLTDLIDGSIDATTGSVTLTGTGAINGSSIHAGQSVAATATTTFNVGTVLADAGSASIHAGGDLTVTTVDAGGAVTLVSGGNINAQDITAGGAATETATGSIAGHSLHSDGDAQFSGTDVNMDLVNVGGNLSGTALGALGLVNTTVTGDTTLDASGAATLGSLHTGNDLGITANVIDAGDLHAGRDMTLAAIGLLQADWLDIGRDADLHAGTLDITTLGVGRNASLDVAGNASIDSTTVGGDATATIGGDATLGDVTVTGATLLQSTGSTSIHQFTGNGTLGVTTGKALGIDLASVDGNVTLDTVTTLTLGDFTGNAAMATTSGGDTTIGSLKVANTFDANSGAGFNLTTGTVGGDATVTATGAFGSGHLDVGGNLVAQAASTMDLDQTTVGQDAKLAAGAALTSNTLGVGHDLQLNGSTSATLGSTTVGNDAVLATGTSLKIGSITAGNDLTATSDGDTSIDVATLGRDALLNAGLGMTLGTVTSGRDIVGTAGDDLAFNELDADRNITLRSLRGRILGGTAHATYAFLATAQTDIDADTLTAGTSLDATATNGSIDVGTATAGTSFAATAGTDLTIGAATAGQGATIKAGQDLHVDTLGVTGDVLATAGRDAYAGNVTVTGNLTGVAGRDLTVNDYDVTKDVSLTAGRDMFLGRGKNAGQLDLSLGRNLDFASLTAGGPITIDSSGGTVHGGDLITDLATIGARDGIVLDTSHIGTRLNLASADIDAHVIQTTTGKPMTMTLTGYHGGVAKKIVVDLRGADSWLIDRLAAVQAVFDTSATSVSMPNATIQGDMWLRTPVATLYMNNVSPKLAQADVQFFEPDTQFQLYQVGKATVSDAFVSRYTVGYDITTPNYIATHTNTDLDFLGDSVLRYLGSTLTLHTNQTSTDGDESDTPLPPADRHEHQNDIVQSAGPVAVNLGAPN